MDVKSISKANIAQARKELGDEAVCAELTRRIESRMAKGKKPNPFAVETVKALGGTVPAQVEAQVKEQAAKRGKPKASNETSLDALMARYEGIPAGKLRTIRSRTKDPKKLAAMDAVLAQESPAQTQPGLVDQLKAEVAGMNIDERAALVGMIMGE
ncbi:hypothetical protein GCM10023116_48010 [Kistimonas scapharcae]|uniref:Uncharacterized protein n=1 Tax=Kistimonas scapharcae TaxID=1036133 RepID=A0ABP8VC13_9GAMM